MQPPEPGAQRAVVNVHQVPASAIVLPPAATARTCQAYVVADRVNIAARVPAIRNHCPSQRPLSEVSMHTS